MAFKDITQVTPSLPPSENATKISNFSTQATKEKSSPQNRYLVKLSCGPISFLGIMAPTFNLGGWEGLPRHLSRADWAGQSPQTLDMDTPPPPGRVISKTKNMHGKSTVNNTEGRPEAAVRTRAQHPSCLGDWDLRTGDLIKAPSLRVAVVALTSGRQSPSPRPLQFSTCSRLPVGWQLWGAHFSGGHVFTDEPPQHAEAHGVDPGCRRRACSTAPRAEPPPPGRWGCGQRRASRSTCPPPRPAAQQGRSQGAACSRQQPPSHSWRPAARAWSQQDHLGMRG